MFTNVAQGSDDDFPQKQVVAKRPKVKAILLENNDDDRRGNQEEYKNSLVP